MLQTKIMRGIIALPFFFATIFGSVITLFDDDSQDPDCTCDGVIGVFKGLSTYCDTEKFDGLGGHSIIQILYDVMMQSTLPNETFYGNDTHVTCLFKDKHFVLGGAGDLTLSWDASGTICVYPSDVPEGGLTLGQIKDLTHSLLSPSCHCGTCGIITANYISQNTSQLGALQFNWDDSAVCESSDNCIDPSKDSMQPANGTGNSTDDKPSGAAGRFGEGLDAFSGLGIFFQSAFAMSLVAAGAAFL